MEAKQKEAMAPEAARERDIGREEKRQPERVLERRVKGCSSSL